MRRIVYITNASRNDLFKSNHTVSQLQMLHGLETNGLQHVKFFEGRWAPNAKPDDIIHFIQSANVRAHARNIIAQTGLDDKTAAETLVVVHFRPSAFVAQELTALLMHIVELVPNLLLITEDEQNKQHQVLFNIFKLHYLKPDWFSSVKDYKDWLLLGEIVQMQSIPA